MVISPVTGWKKVPNLSVFVTRTLQLGPYRARFGEVALSCPGVSWAAGLSMSGAESPAIHWLWDAHKPAHWSSLVSHGDLGWLLRITTRYSSSITPRFSGGVALRRQSQNALAWWSLTSAGALGQAEAPGGSIKRCSKSPYSQGTGCLHMG